MPSRSLPVPDGLAGERVDAALAKLLGLSRTFAAEIAEGGGVRVDDRPAGKADRLTAGAWLEVVWEDRAAPGDRAGRGRRASAIVFDDDDIVVVDKPAGVAAHPVGRLGRSDGARRPCRGRVPRSRPQGPRSEPGSSTGWTSARAG